MAKKPLSFPLASITCDVDYTKVRAEDVPGLGPVVCPTCGRWLGVLVAVKR